MNALRASTHKEVKMVNFLLCICYHNKKIGLLYPTYMPFMLCIVFLALMVLFISYLLLPFTTVDGRNGAPCL